MDQKEQNKLKNLAEAKPTDEEMATHLRVFEMSSAMGDDPHVAMTRGTQAVIGLRLYGGKESVHRQLKEGWNRIYEETLRAEAEQKRGSLACPSGPEQGSIILTGVPGVIQH